jgi:hypothetical protein
MAPTGSRLRKPAATVLLLAVVAFPAACSGGSSPHVASLGSVTATTQAPVTPAAAPFNKAAAVAKYVSCLRAHGVTNLPIVSGNNSGVRIQVNAQTSGPQFQQAAAACRNDLPHGTVQPNITTAQQQDYLQAAACMRSHGITNFPDPVISGPNVHFPIPPGVNINAPQVVQAIQICRKLIPPGLPYRS